MPALRKYRGFISHAWEYNSDYYTLEGWLKEEPLFDWENYSVPEHDSLKTSTNAALKRALRSQIRPTNHVLILAGMYVSYREWIQIEIDIAVEMDKPIIGILPWGNMNIPKAVQDTAVTEVGWNRYSVIEAIREYSL